MNTSLLSILVIFCFTQVSFSQDPVFEWAGKIGSNQGDAAEGIAVDNDGNAYVVGYFNATIDFDPGPGVFELTPYANADSYIAKYSDSGNLVWAINLPCSSGSLIRDIELDDQANIYVVGEFNDTVDLDPGPGVWQSICNEDGRAFVLKLDSAGNFINAIEFASTEGSAVVTVFVNSNDVIISGTFKDSMDFDPGPGTDYSTATVSWWSSFSAKLDHDLNVLWYAPLKAWNEHVFVSSAKSDSYGNVYTYGSYENVIDMDPGPGTYNLWSADAIFIQKLDPNGNFIWAKQATGSVLYSHDLIIDDSSFIYCSGMHLGGIDLSFTAVNNSISNVGGYDAFLIKLDTNGNTIWFHNYNSNSGDQLSGIKQDENGFLYIIGRFGSTFDFDPGWVYDPHSSNGSYDIFIQKLDSSGNVIWTETLGGIGSDEEKGIAINGMDLFFVGSFFDVVDFDPDSSNYDLSSDGYADVFYTKWSQDSCSIMYVIVDSVSNATCTDSAFASSYVSNAVYPVNYIWDTGTPTLDSIMFTDQGGIYTVSVEDMTGCLNSKTILIEGPNGQAGYDLQGSIVHTPFWVGFSTNFWIDVFNDGCNPVDTEIQFTLPGEFNVNWISPSPDSIINGSTFIWNINSFDYDDGHFAPILNASLVPGIPIEERLCLGLTVLPISGDNDSTNNVKEYCSLTTGSYDPNDKKVYPEGSCNDGFVLLNQSLTYHVRFQNTGNAPAVDVVVVDTLSPHLDVQSIQLLGQSHSGLIVEIEDTNCVKFRFNDIYLPDSTTNPLGSNGYFIFNIDPIDSITNNTQIENKVNIFFDFNDPIETNSVSNTYVNYIPFDETTLYDSICGTYYWNNMTYDSSGHYVQSLFNQNNCDSIIHLFLTTFDTALIIQSNGQYLETSSGASLYQWYNCITGLPVPGQTTNVFYPDENGQYFVYANFLECNDSSDCFTVDFLSNENNALGNSMFVYPNPTNKNSVILESTDILLSGELLLYDSSGRILYRQNLFETSKIEVPINGKKGLYTLQIISKNRTEQLIISKI